MDHCAASAALALAAVPDPRSHCYLIYWLLTLLLRHDLPLAPDPPLQLAAAELELNSCWSSVAAAAAAVATDAVPLTVFPSAGTASLGLGLEPTDGDGEVSSIFHLNNANH